MSYDVLRKGRYSQRYHAYCITTVTRDRQPLFTDLDTARMLVHELRRLHENDNVTSLAWVIMPDHLHWLIQLGGFDEYSGRINSALQGVNPNETCRAEFIRPGYNRGKMHGRMNSALQETSSIQEYWSLSWVMKTFKARSALAINRYRSHSGSIWQRAYYDRAVRKEEDIRRIARYIVANPLRAGLVRNVGDYPHWDCIWMTDC